ncbi:hypothetical protein LWP59_03655 [Amycolatopsis acidiphila]|uniref:Uncharacterized protein n=1 Tax=Amycolatopsis acidiphila TaxID=715473 RepID=A0A557ZNH6_9PSEU|nr:hypothetical protein [Amycolatopsis acidiphila]TVT13584.1 hypothetical protein FNH06_38900 [Amycolatopsis acidiphila]UIJ60790.1 hypothetical protein LWP59_03655 [Amycolatopsis acidiphila]GHG93914.1 hypothetical protein GCM10017788_71520 [Amycolatopsis acidiphila]
MRLETGLRRRAGAWRLVCRMVWRRRSGAVLPSAWRRAEAWRLRAVLCCRMGIRRLRLIVWRRAAAWRLRAALGCRGVRGPLLRMLSTRAGT